MKNVTIFELSYAYINSNVDYFVQLLANIFRSQI